MTSPDKEPNFLRVLGRRDALALAFGAMIGWSWVVLSGTWIESAGSIRSYHRLSSWWRYYASNWTYLC